MTQSREEMHKRIRKASNRKILRQQIEMLTEYSRTCGIDRAPEACQAIAFLYRRLVEAEHILLVRILIALFVFLYMFKRFSVKIIELIKR